MMLHPLFISFLTMKCLNYKFNSSLLYNETNKTFHKINIPKKWNVIPYELQPYELDHFLTI